MAELMKRCRRVSQQRSKETRRDKQRIEEMSKNKRDESRVEEMRKEYKQIREEMSQE